MTLFFFAVALSVVAYVGYKAGCGTQRVTDIGYVGETIRRICDDSDMPDEFGNKMVLAVQMSIVLEEIPTCACGNHVMISDVEHLRRNGIVHTLDGCDF